MLVKFSSEVHEDIIMLGDVAKKLIKMMGYSGSIPSAIAAEDVPNALENLKKAVSESKSAPVNNQDEDEEPVSLANRAWPLIEMLEAAEKSNKHVMWQEK